MLKLSEVKLFYFMELKLLLKMCWNAQSQF